jgi:hypothetical protein
VKDAALVGNAIGQHQKDTQWPGRFVTPVRP